MSSTSSYTQDDKITNIKSVYWSHMDVIRQQQTSTFTAVCPRTHTHARLWYILQR